MSERSTTIDLQQGLERLAAGDAKAKNDLVTRGIGRLRMIARKLLRSFGGEARVGAWTDEIVADAYTRLNRALDEVKPTSVQQFLGLARLQMERALQDRIRSIEGRTNKRDRPVSLNAADSDSDAKGFDPSTEDGGKQRDLVIDLLTAVQGLDEPVAAVVWLRLESYSFPEIGELLEIHKDTAERRWNVAVVKLGKRLAPFMSSI